MTSNLNVEKTEFMIYYGHYFDYYPLMEKEGNMSYTEIEEGFEQIITEFYENVDKKSKNLNPKEFEISALDIYMQTMRVYNMPLTQEQVNLLSVIKDIGYEAKENLENGNGNLNHEQKEELQKKIFNGDRAVEIFASTNQGLVLSVAKKYFGCPLPIDDLIQAGNEGLLRAIQGYDYTKGYKFSTYATWWIRQRIVRTLENTSKAVRIPVHMGESIGKYNRTTQELTAQFGRNPTVEEIALATGFSKYKVKMIQSSIKPVVSLDQVFSDKEDITLGETLSSKDNVENTVLEILLKEKFEEILDTFPPRTAKILSLRYGLNGFPSMTFQEIGEKMGVTRERIRQIEQETFRKIREMYPDLQK